MKEIEIVYVLKPATTNALAGGRNIDRDGRNVISG